MANLSIKSKLLVMLLAVSLFSIAVVASLNYYTCYKALQTAMYSHLTSVRASRADQIEQFIERLRVETRVIGGGAITTLAARDFIDGYRQLEEVAVGPEMDLAVRKYYQETFLPALGSAMGSEPEVNAMLPQRTVSRYLQYQYIAKNPFPVREKGEMLSADDGSVYSRHHEKLHGGLKRIFTELGFSDAYIIEIETGAVVYSLNKEPDFATSLMTGPYAHSHLAELFRRLQRAPDRGVVDVVDFEAYRPSLGDPAAFIGTPVFDEGRASAVLILQLSDEAIDRVMTGGHQWERDGLGKTGETYLVGPDFLMRSNSRFLIEDPDAYAAQLREHQKMPEAEIDRIIKRKSSILTQRVRSVAAEQAMAGNEGTGPADGYRGIPMLGSWGPLRVAGLEWGIVAKIDRDEAYAPMAHIARDTLIQTLLILLVITLVVMFLATSFVRPVNELIARVQLARTGKTDMTFSAESTDEIGDLARSFRELIGSVQKQTKMLEAATSENQLLLENVMPKRIADRVRDGGVVTEHFEDVTVVFAELRGLAQFTQATSDDESVTALKRLITAFDESALRYGVERIKTIGDTYLAVTGLSQPLLDHMRRSLEFALAARAIVADLAREIGAPLGLTVGIGSGPVVADVMGQGHAQFQLWGAAVIAADHAMDCGGIGDIVVSSSVRDGLADQYAFKPLETSTSGVPLWTLVDRD